MTAPIGSVYLDQPRPRRVSPTARRDRRAAIAAQLSFIGILGLTLAGVLVGVRSTVSSPDPTIAAIQSTFEDPVSRAEIEAEIALAIRTDLLTPQLLEAGELYGVDADAEIDAWAAAVLDDPDFSDAVGELITDLHARVFVEADPGPVDVGPLTDVVIATAADTAPTLASFLPPDGHVITIDVSDLPDLTRPMALIDRAILIALLSGAALPLSLLVHRRRHRVLAWTGRWLLVVGVVLGIAAIGLPYVAGRFTGWVTVETAVRSTSFRLLAPAGIAGTVGMGLASLAVMSRRREKRKVAQEGAAAWLDVIEPPPATALSSPSLDLARRGLVDGSSHLTSS